MGKRQAFVSGAFLLLREQSCLELPPRTSEERDMKNFMHIKLTGYYVYLPILYMCFDMLQCFVLYGYVKSYKSCSKMQ